MNGKSVFTQALMIAAIMNVICGVTNAADESVLSDLKSVKLVIVDASEVLGFRIRNSVELKLRKAGIKVLESSPIQLQLKIVSINIDPSEKEFLGRYGSVTYKLYEPVVLARSNGILSKACTWEGSSMMMHGPPDNVEDRIANVANTLTDEFLNRWHKANDSPSNESSPAKR